ncbi:MAG: IclR family transcriptional regulator [Deltaproteobacteria bacterium]|nr:IclR family transcriptional regulator [Deltaproteobacteria bacterium]
MGEGYRAPSVEKAFRILRLLSLSERGLGISELAKRLSMSKGTIHGITSALEKVGAVRRDPSTKRYTLGYTLFELGRRAIGQVDLKQLARPVMENLMQKTQASVFLGVLNRDHVTILDVVESTSDFKITSPVGTTIPILAGAVGKVLMACLSEAQVMNIVGALGLHKYTEHSITSPGEYFEQIRKVRDKGYAEDDEEYIPGVRAVAAPIQGLGDTLYAVWAVGFKAILDDEKMKLVARETRDAARLISRWMKKNPDLVS